MLLRLGSLIVTLVAIAGCAAMPRDPVGLTNETFMVPSLDANIELYVRNKRLASKEAFPPDRILLMVHGAVVSSETVFDLDLPGGSWMEFAARRGFDVYSVDIRGFGRSTRPAAMNQPPQANGAFLHEADAIRDISAAVAFILKRTKAERISLLGWSWGTAVMAGYAIQNPQKVEKLVLFAPIWHPRKLRPADSSYQFVDIANAKRDSNIPPDRVDEILPFEWFEKYRAAILATDPVGAARTPPGIRVPTLGRSDIESWAAGRATYDPGAVRAPTLVIVGEWDGATPPTMARELFQQLTGTPYRRLIVLSGGSHTIMIQKNRMHLIREVQHFLEEPHP